MWGKALWMTGKHLKLFTSGGLKTSKLDYLVSQQH